MARELAVTGGKEIAATLTALGKKMESQIVRSALRAAAAPIRDEARLRAPKKTGKMAKSIKTGSPRRNQDGSYEVRVRLQGDHAFLGYFHEYGVAPHLIKISDDLAAQTEAKLRPSKRGRSRKTVTRYANELIESGSLKIGDNFVGEMVQHPGHAARPFMRPALDARADDAVEAFRQKIIAVVEGRTGFNLDAGIGDAD